MTDLDYRDDFLPHALELADQLRNSALHLVGVGAGGLGCGHGDTYRLAPDAPLPTWLHTELSRAELSAPEGPWPQFARTEAPIDWVTLITTHPDVLVPDHEMLAANRGASWGSIVLAYVFLAVRGCAPVLDVCLSIAPDGRISVEPIGLFGEGVSSAIETAADAVLVSGGREHTDLRDSTDGPGLWLLDG